MLIAFSLSFLKLKVRAKFILSRVLGKPHSLTPADIIKLANQTERYTCCDLANVFSKAGFHAVRELGAFEDMNDLDPDDVRFFLCNGIWF